MAKSLTCLLITIQTPEETTTTVVTDAQFYIGRSTECTLPVRSANVSRQHLLIKNKSGKVWIEDQGSSNGTSVNGQALTGKRLTPVNTDDKIMLGTSISISIIPVLRAMTESVVSESGIKAEDKEQLMSLIQGAHAEAKRLVDMGKEMHDGYIRTAEETAAAIEKKMSANFEQVMTEATQNAKNIVQRAQRQHDEILKDIREDALAVKESEMKRVMKEAQDAAAAKIESAKRESEEFVAEAKNECNKYLSEAKEKSETFIREAQAKAAELIADAKKQSAELVANGKRESEEITLKAHQKSEVDARDRRSRQEAELIKEHAENKKKLEAEIKLQREKQNQEMVQLRLEQLEELKRERASAISEFARERRQIGEDILKQAEAVALKSISTDAWLPIAKKLEEAILTNFDAAPAAEGSQDQISPLVAKVNRQRTRMRVTYTLQGLFLGMLIWVSVDRTAHYMMNEASPMKSAAEHEAQRMQDDLEARKFDPPQDDDWRESYSDSVIYTRDFAHKYLAEDFQKTWAKKAQKYFLKNWRVEEEKVVAVIAKLNAMVSALSDAKRAIHPDFVKKGVQKMKDLEAATLAEVKEILGSAVRVEALKQVEKKTYSSFYSERTPATEVKPPEDATE